MSDAVADVVAEGDAEGALAGKIFEAHGARLDIIWVPLASVLNKPSGDGGVSRCLGGERPNLQLQMAYLLRGEADLCRRRLEASQDFNVGIVRQLALGDEPPPGNLQRGHCSLFEDNWGSCGLGGLDQVEGGSWGHLHGNHNKSVLLGSGSGARGCWGESPLTKALLGGGLGGGIVGEVLKSRCREWDRECPGTNGGNMGSHLGLDGGAEVEQVVKENFVVVNGKPLRAHDKDIVAPSASTQVGAHRNSKDSGAEGDLSEWEMAAATLRLNLVDVASGCVLDVNISSWGELEEVNTTFFCLHNVDYLSHGGNDIRDRGVGEPVTGVVVVDVEARHDGDYKKDEKQKKAGRSERGLSV